MVLVFWGGETSGAGRKDVRCALTVVIVGIGNSIVANLTNIK